MDLPIISGDETFQTTVNLDTFILINKLLTRHKEIATKKNKKLPNIVFEITKDQVDPITKNINKDLIPIIHNTIRRRKSTRLVPVEG